ncbi:hypothetical protein OK016_10535 [Vibrio chagasii]|nr:hypothetical protein [Vibrio chagasii]
MAVFLYLILRNRCGMRVLIRRGLKGRFEIRVNEMQKSLRADITGCESNGFEELKGRFGMRVRDTKSFKSRCEMRVIGIRRAEGQIRDAGKRDAKSLRAGA